MSDIIPNRPEVTSADFSTDEAKDRAKKAILETMGLQPTENLARFSELLKEAVKSLPQYKQFEQEMAPMKDAELPHSVFRVIRKANDAPQAKEATPTDGVLISSMRQGHTECAGRTLIASTYLIERGFPHTVVDAPSHSMLLFEIGEDTLAYGDPNNNLYFTFPKNALSGYEGVSAVSECHLQAYNSRPQDVSDGFASVYRDFISTPAREGITRQYLENVHAALAGNSEFKNSSVNTDSEAANAVDIIQNEILGKVDSRILEYHQKETEIIKGRELQGEKLIEELKKILPITENKTTFIEKFIFIFQQSGQDLFPYLNSIPIETIKHYASDFWDKYKNNK